MHIDPSAFRERAREAIREKFRERMQEAKAADQPPEKVAKEIALSRTMLSNYDNKAKRKKNKDVYAAMPGADVLLAALLKWDWTIKVENAGGTPGWFVFGLVDMEGGLASRPPAPAQLLLFEALTDLDQQIDSLKKTVGRAEVEVQRALAQRRPA